MRPPLTKLKAELKKDITVCVEQIKQLQNPEDVANLLEVPLGQLLYILYKLPEEKQCKTFTIPKKTKGHRTIKASIGGKRILQDKLKPILSELYRTKACVHGFAYDRSIVTNASAHRKRKYILNIDLKDFFPTIHFGRVRGLFMGYPFNMGEKAASVMAQICTQSGSLSQGSPLSPVISNYIASDLDKKMTNIAKRYKLTYTRYADDITFSTSRNHFPVSIARWDGDNPVTNKVVLGNLLVETIEAAGFEINYDKVRMQIKSVRQEVTGLIVNEFPNLPRSYIKNLRAMLHAWKTHGIINAEKTLIDKFAQSPPQVPEEERDGTYFKNVLYGKIAFVKMVRGEDDDIYRKLCLKAASLDTNAPKFIKKIKIMYEEFDVFLCHASEDKEKVVRPIYDELDKLGVKAFLDEAHIEWGSSITEKINKALGQAKFVLAVLSENSVDKVWPQKEINAALARELVGKQKILPLMVGKPELTSLSLLEDKLYIEYKNDPKDIAEKIFEQLDSTPKTQPV
jgi:RNA-directed DNA polymerase